MTQTRLEAHAVRDGMWRSLRDTVTVSDPSPSLGLLISSVELEMWKDRKDNGPFAVAGDFSTNSPGHWAEMNARMSLDFTAQRWSGPTVTSSSDGRILHLNDGAGYDNDPPSGVRQMASDMMSAAYAAIVTENTAVAESIVAEIAWQASQTQLNYANRTLWPYDYYHDLNPLFIHALWVLDYVVAYDVCKTMGVGTGTQQADIEKWFLDLADLCEQILQNNLGKRFPNRRSDSYAARDQLVDNEAFVAMRTADGNAVWYPRILLFYNNRRHDQATLCGMVGALTGNQFYIDEFKRYTREWVMFGNSVSSGSRYHWGDVDRGSTNAPQLGLSYGINSTSRMLNAIDAIARQGDTDIYDFQSSEGSALANIGTDHFKTTEQCLNNFMGWFARTWPAYYTGGGSWTSPPSTSIVGDPYHRVQSRYQSTGRELVADAGFLLAANYYGRPDWQDIVLRSGTPTGFTNPPQQAGAIVGWAADRRQRFLRSLDANPHGGT